LEQISIAEPLAKNGETCISPQAWKYVDTCVTEGRLLEDYPDFHILVQMDESKYTYPTVRNAAMERDSRNDMCFQLPELPVCRLYIPSSVFKQIEGGTLTYVNEMRNIATIFISGSGVDVSTDAGSKVAQELMSGVQYCCYAHEGTLNKYLVDDKGMLFLLVYGLPPMVHPDDPSRAVLACLDIIEVFKRLGLVGRCGVTTGRNYCGVVGSAKRMEYTVLGDTVNLAARLMANARELSVLVDEATRALSQKDIGYKALEAIMVKGKTNRIPIFEPIPLGLTDSMGLRPDNSIGFPWKPLNKYLGGESILCELQTWEEMAKMKSLLQDAENAGGPGSGNTSNLFSGGGVMIIGGEMGMGKTELSEFLVMECHTRFKMIPIFGTAGSRPGQKFRPIQELLRTLVMAFRHADAALPSQDLEALLELTGKYCPGDDQEFVRDLKPDLGLPDNAVVTSYEQCRVRDNYCHKGIDLVTKLVRQLTKERVVLCTVSMRSGSNIFESKEGREDEEMFWELVSRLCDLTKEGTRNPLVIVVIVKTNQKQSAEDSLKCEAAQNVRQHVKSEGWVKCSRLPDDLILEYMGKHLELAQSKVPESLHRYVSKITEGNALFIRETIDQLLSYGHISVLTDGSSKPESMKCTTDFESINIADWANTSMVGGTICLLESLDPLQAAVVKMATVFHGIFTVSDLAASSCSRWAGATYFDAVRVFYSLKLLVDDNIIDRAEKDVDKGFLGNAEGVIECFRLNNVLIRKVGNSMVLEAQKKSVKRQALMDRVLAKELPSKMIEVRRKKAIQHIPWYYQIDQAEGKARPANG